MTTTATRRTSPIVLLVLAAILLIALPPLNHHAVARHGINAAKAWSRVARVTPTPDGSNYWHGVDPDTGRDIHIVTIERNRMWAIVILGGGGTFLVTAFLCSSKNTVRKIKRRCEGGEQWRS